VDQGGGKDGTTKPKNAAKMRGQNPVHTDNMKALEVIAPSFVEAQFENSEAARGAIEIRHRNLAINQSCVNVQLQMPRT